MEEKSIGDLVIDEMLELRKLVRAELHEQYKRTKPLRGEKIKPYSQWDENYEMYLRQTMGDDNVNQLIQDEMRRQGYAKW